MRLSLPHFAPLGGLLCLALAAGTGVSPAVAADAKAKAALVALGGGDAAASLLEATQLPQAGAATAPTQTAQAGGQDDAQLAAVVERVCPTLDTCRQALAGLLVRLNTTQQQLINAQEKIRQLQDFVRLVENARQAVRQNPDLAGQGLTGDAAAVVEQLQLQLGFSAAEIQTLEQARDQALAALEKVSNEARVQARSALAQSQEVQRLQARLAALGEDVETDSAANTTALEPSDGSDDQGGADLMADSEAEKERAELEAARRQQIETLLQERDLLRAEILRLNTELRDLRPKSANAQSPGQPLLDRPTNAQKGQLARLQAEVERLRDLNKSLEAKDLNTRGRIDGLQSSLTQALVRVEELSAERDRLRAQAGTGDSESVAVDQDLATLRDRLTDLAEERDLAVQQMQAAQAQLQGLEMADAAREQEQRAREALSERLADLEAELVQERATIATLRAEKTRLEQEIEEGGDPSVPEQGSDGRVSALEQELQASRADKAALERQLIKLEADRRSRRDDLERMTTALQQRDQAIADLQAQVTGLVGKADAGQAADLQQVQEALANEQAARVQERGEFQRLVDDLQSKNQQLLDTLTRVQAVAATEKEELVAEIVRLTDEARELREFVNLQRGQSGDQQDAVARLTQALEDAERQRAAQLDLLGRAQNEIEALLAELGQARTAAANNDSQKQKAIDDALRLRQLLDDLIQERDALSQEVAELRQAGQREQRNQELLASTQQRLREIESERDELRRALASKQREVLELSRQLQRRQDFIANQKAVGRNYDMLAEQLNDAEAQLILARMQVSSLQQRLQALGVSPVPNFGDKGADAASSQPPLSTAAPQTNAPITAAPIPGVDPAQDARTLRLLEELRRIGRP